MFRSNKSRRDADQQRLHAAARREHLDQLLRDGQSGTSDPQSQDIRQANPISRPPQPSEGVAKALLWVLGATGSVIAGLLYGGPLFGQTWRAVPLLLASSVFVIASAEALRQLRKLRSLDTIWMTALAVLTVGVFLLGVQGQVVVNGKPYWRNSDTAQAYQLAVAIRSDLYLLQENQSLLSYPPEQARGLLPLFTTAALQAEELAKRWNPATAPSDLPAPGFVVVYQKVNSAADLQRQALLGYAAYLQQPDTLLASEVDKARLQAEQMYLIAAGELAASVKPLGINLSEQES